MQRSNILTPSSFQVYCTSSTVPIQRFQEGQVLQPVSTYWKDAANDYKLHSTLEYAHMALDADVCICLLTCTHNLLLHMFVYAAVSVIH